MGRLSRIAGIDWSAGPRDRLHWPAMASRSLALRMVGEVAVGFGERFRWRRGAFSLGGKSSPGSWNVFVGTVERSRLTDD
jgi:hypothetical protein